MLTPAPEIISNKKSHLAREESSLIRSDYKKVLNRSAGDIFILKAAGIAKTIGFYILFPKLPALADHRQIVSLTLNGYFTTPSSFKAARPARSKLSATSFSTSILSPLPVTVTLNRPPTIMLYSPEEACLSHCSWTKFFPFL